MTPGSTGDVQHDAALMLHFLLDIAIVQFDTLSTFDKHAAKNRVKEKNERRKRYKKCYKTTQTLYIYTMLYQLDNDDHAKGISRSTTSTSTKKSATQAVVKL